MFELISLQKRKNIDVKITFPENYNMFGHWPDKMARSRRCRICWKQKKRKETCYTCTCCGIPLCIVPCFKYYHVLNNLNQQF